MIGMLGNKETVKWIGRDSNEEIFDYLGKVGLRRLGINDEDKGNLTFDSPPAVRQKEHIHFHSPIKLRIHAGAT